MWGLGVKLLVRGLGVRGAAVLGGGGCTGVSGVLSMLISSPLNASLIPSNLLQVQACRLRVEVRVRARVRARVRVGVRVRLEVRVRLGLRVRVELGVRVEVRVRVRKKVRARVLVAVRERVEVRMRRVRSEGCREHF